MAMTFEFNIRPFSYGHDKITFGRVKVHSAGSKHEYMVEFKTVGGWRTLRGTVPKVQADGKYSGVGIDFVAEDGVVRVVTPINGGPAYLAGVEAGDLITHVDGRPVHMLTANTVIQRVRGEPGSKVTITFRRNDGQPFDLTLTRADVSTRSVLWRAEGSSGYVRISSFNGQTGDSLTEAITALRGELGSDWNGMVLDLRRNPGGLLSEAVAISDAFLDEGGIVEVLGRWQDDNRRYDATPGDLTAGAPLVVLIDGGSASASELVAGALQDNRRAIIMGSRSFGKGTVQSIVPLRSGDTGIRLTTARYHTPSGRSVTDAAIVPNVAIVSQDDGVGGYTSLGSPDVIDAGRCPAAGPGKQDRALGCALVLLDAGELGEFLARMRPYTKGR